MKAIYRALALALVSYGLACGQSVSGGGGSGNVADGGNNGGVYRDSSGALHATATGGAGTLCFVSANGGTPVFGSCAGSASTLWSALSNPTGNMAINVGTFTSQWTVQGNTAATNLFSIIDTTGNTGTGSLFEVHTVGSSTAKPFTFTAQGTANGVQMSNAGALAKIGTGSIAADSMAVGGLTGLGTGVATFLATPSGTNLASALTTSLLNTKGGTGGDSSAQTGIAHVAAGTWSYSTIVAADIAANAVTLAKLATQAADTTLVNATGSTAVPTAVAFPTTGTNGCAGSNDAIGYNTTSHAFVCNTIAGGGSTAFSALTGSTNTTAAMVVGTGASLAASGSGTITATAIAVGGITGLGTGVATFLATPSGTNLATALTTSLLNSKGGTGGDSSASTGIAHVAAGTWSYSAIVNADITNATIDLTTKVTGILPTANGGTANAFFTVSGPATSAKTYTFPNASTTVLTTNAAVTAGQGGTGVANTATLTLGSSNQNWATLATGIVKNTTTTGALSVAVSSDVYGLWSGSCSSSTFLRGDGACATPSGSGTVTVVASGSLTSTACVTGGGTTTLQTPSAGCTVDSSGNLVATSLSTGTSPPTVTAGTGGVQGFGEGTVPSACAAAAVDCVYADSTQHGFLASFNNGSYLPLVQGPASSTANHVPTFNSTTGGLFKDSGLTLTASTGTITLTNAKTFSVTNTLTLSGTDATVMTFPTTSATIARTDAANTFTGTQTIGALVATTVNGNTFTTGTGVLTIAAGKTLTQSNTLTYTGTDGSSVAFGTGGTVVYTTRTLTAGVGIAAIGDLSADRTISVDSTKQGFLTAGALTCGASTNGKMEVHTTPLQYCDNTATPVLRYAAYGDTGGNALTGDSATAFFSTGNLEKAIQNASTVYNDAANTWSTGAQDFGAATSLKIPVGAGATTATNGFIAYDSTNNMLHAAQSGADAKIPQFTITPGNGDCAKWTVSGSNYKLDTAGAACGSGASSAGSSLFSATGSTTVTATSATTLIGSVSGSTTVPVNTFTVGQVLHFSAQGYYSTPATATSLTIDLKVGGTTRVTTGAVVQVASVTNGAWQLSCDITTRTTGASGTQIANCIFLETGATIAQAGSPMFTSSAWTIDTTATEALDLQATWSTATGSPTITSTNVSANIPGAPVTSVNTKTGAVALTLNSSDFANEGTTTTLLHGNAAGNPSFSAVSLTADVSGVLPTANIAVALANQTSINGLGITASTGTLAITNAKTFSVSNTLTLAGTDGVTYTGPSTSQTLPGMNQTNTAGSSMVWDLSAASVTAGLKIPSAAGAVPTADGFEATNTTNHTHVWGSNGTTMVGAIAATSTGTATTCTAPQVITAISSLAVPTCSAPLLTQNSQSAAYITVLGDAGKMIYHPGADTTARTWTIDSNANVAYAIGTCISFFNDTSAGVITIAITSDTLVLAGAGTTGSRTLAASNVATACKMTSTRWMISGSSGLT